MDKNYIAPAGALKKARSVPQTVYLYGATGYGKTEQVHQYLSGRRYTYLSCEELPWEAGALPPEETGKQSRRVVVIDDLHRLKNEELRRQIIALEQRDDIWLILISRSPIPGWLISQHIKDIFVVISEDDLRLRAGEISSYLDACGVAHTEDDVQYLQGTAEKGEDNYKVMTLLARAQMETEQNGMLEIAFAAVGVRVRLALFPGDGPAALELLNAFEQSVREGRAVQLLPNIQALWCRLALYEGNSDRVDCWMKTAPAKDKEFCSLERYRYLTKVRCYLAKGEHLLAQALLEKLRYYAEQTNRPYVRMETGLLSAITKERIGEPWQEELSAVLHEAEHYRFLRLISEEGAAMWPLLQQEKKSLLDAGTLDRDWLRRLLNETEEMARRYPLYLKKRAATAADFGGTALSILRLQADGLSVNRIADKLAMKPDNVKYHIKENYRELNAASKADALLAARSLGLL